MPLDSPLMNLEIEQVRANVRRAVSLLKAVGHEPRMFILCHLASGEKSVGELQELVGTSQSGMSQHLRLLRQLDLVRVNRKAQTMYYSLHGVEAKTLIAALYNLYCPKPALLEF